MWAGTCHTPDRVGDEAEALSLPLPSLFSLLGFSLPPDSDPGFSDPSFLQGSVYRNLLWGQPLRSSLIVWHNGSMPGIAFSIIWASFPIFFLSCVCVHIISVSLFLPISPPPSKNMDSMTSRILSLFLVSTMGLAHLVVSTGKLLTEWLRVCVHILCLWGRVVFSFMDSTKQILS